MPRSARRPGGTWRGPGPPGRSVDRSIAEGATEASASAPTYVVRAGDTLETIATSLGVTVGQLRHWNDERYPGLLPVMTLPAGIELATTGAPLPLGATVAPASIASSRVPDYDFLYDWTDSDCAVVATAPEPVHLVYEVVLPRWTPPANVTNKTIEWWTAKITDLTAHEAGHVQIYERYLAELNRTVREGSCVTVEDELDAIFGELDRANCEYDFAEYASAMGLGMESCLET